MGLILKPIKYIKEKAYSITLRLSKPKIEVYSAKLSGDDSFIDIRYFITRPDQIKGGENIFAIDQISGEIFMLASIERYGVLKTKHNKQLRSGIALFINKDKKIYRGSKLTLVYGSLSKKDITLQ